MDNFSRTLNDLDYYRKENEKLKLLNESNEKSVENIDEKQSDIIKENHNTGTSLNDSVIIKYDESHN